MTNYDFRIKARGKSSSGREQLLKELKAFEQTRVRTFPFTLIGKTFTASNAYQNNALDIEMTGDSPVVQWAVDRGFTLYPTSENQAVIDRAWKELAS